MSTWLQDASKVIPEDSLSLVSRSVTALDTVVTDISEAEAQLKEMKKQRGILETNLADTLSKHGMSELKLQDGRRVVLSEDLKVKLPADPVQRHVVLSFIEAHGGVDIIKDKLTLENPSEALVNALADRGETFERKSEVHPQTLAAFFREQLGLKKGFAPQVSASDVPAEAGLFMYKKISIR